MSIKAQQKMNGDSILSLILITLTALGITVTGIITEQSALRIAPLYVSLLIGMLQASANRYASLIGGINSVLYAVVYFYFGLYASAASAILISCPFQIATFIRWSKHRYKHSTHFRRLSGKWRLIVGSTFLVAFVIIYALLSVLDSSYRMLDITLSLISVFTSVLTLLSYIEYSWLMLATGVCSILLDATMMQDHPGQLTYLVYSIYSMICIIRQYITVHSLYKEQQKGEEI